MTLSFGTFGIELFTFYMEKTDGAKYSHAATGLKVLWFWKLLSAALLIPL